MKLTEREFIGTVLADIDNKSQGRYKVNIPELMPSMGSNSGIFCKNHTHNCRLTSSENGTYGQYFPLHPGTSVIVKFSSNDHSSGYIDRIISDGNSDSIIDPSTGSSTTERDDLYVLIKTPKNNNSFYINEATESDSNSIWLVFNDKRTGIRINEEGLHISTKDNQKIKITGDSELEIVGNCKINVHGTTHIHSTGDCNIDSDGMVNINCGLSDQVSVDEL